jgi:hypothetical protein
MSLDVTSTGVQIHGGMGFIEETGATQFYRDARILPIYEGTNGIQSADLVFRKILRDKGDALKAWLEECALVLPLLKEATGDDMQAIYEATALGFEQVSLASQHITVLAKDDLDSVAAVSVPYLKAMGIFCGGVMLARSALAAQGMLMNGEGNSDFFDQKILTARFYAESILPQVAGQVRTVMVSAKTITSSHF